MCRNAHGYEQPGYEQEWFVAVVFLFIKLCSTGSIRVRRHFALTKKKYWAELVVGVDFLLLYNEDASNRGRRLVESVPLLDAKLQEKVPAKLILHSRNGRKWTLAFSDERQMKEWRVALARARDFSVSAEHLLQQWRDAGCAPDCTIAQIDASLSESVCRGAPEEAHTGHSMAGVGALFLFFVVLSNTL